MKRLTKILLILFPTCFFAQTILTVLAFQRIDLRFQAFALLILVPAVQAALLAWAGRAPDAAPFRVTMRELQKRQPLPGMLLLLDCAVLFPVWLLGESPATGWNWAAKLPIFYSGLKAMIAGAVLAFLARKQGASGRERAWLLLFAAGLAGFGVDCLTGWLEPLAGLLLPRWQLMFRWLFFYGLLFVGSLLVLFKVQAIWSRKSEPAAATIDWAVACAMLAAIIVVIAFFNRPFLLAPWSTLVRTCGVLFVTSILLGCMQLTGRAAESGNAARRRH